VLILSLALDFIALVVWGLSVWRGDMTFTFSGGLVLATMTVLQSFLIAPLILNPVVVLADRRGHSLRSLTMIVNGGAIFFFVSIGFIELSILAAGVEIPFGIGTARNLITLAALVSSVLVIHRQSAQ
jgi:hypothetical protein